MKVFLPALFIIFMIISCGQQEERQSEIDVMPIDTAAVIAKGQEITKAAFKTLSSNLKSAMAKGGVEYALEFCNVEAMPLTDSLSTHLGVKLRRASHRPRNPSNRVDSLELVTIKSYLSKVQSGTDLKPEIYATQKRIEYHAPIKISNQLCLNCHGKPGIDIKKSDLTTLKELYPKDEATGFEIGELRGIWSINFPRSDFEGEDL